VLQPRYCFSFLALLLPFFAFSQTADFSFRSPSGNFCTPTLVDFSQNCTGSPIGFVWDFGNNTRGFSGNVAASYDIPGTYTVKLTAIYTNTTLEISKTVVIHPTINATIAVSSNYICRPGIINFSAASNANRPSYTWDFGDNTGIISSRGRDTAHTFTNYGNYTVILKVTDTTGCFGTVSTVINVSRPAIVGTVSQQTGCIPAAPVFAANVNVPVNDFVTTYSWNYGDGSPTQNTATNSTSHLYNNVGSFLPTLSISTNGGCTNTFNFPSVAFGTPPTNENAYPSKPVYCASETPSFVLTATSANAYLWDFGDGTIAAYTDTLVQHKYNSLGIKTLVATPYFNGCPGQSVTFPIEIVGVLASFNYANTCTNKNTYRFTNTSIGNIALQTWKFGDTSQSLATVDAVHTYPVTGQFTTSLTIVDTITGCRDSTIQVIYTARPRLSNPDSAICLFANTRFTVNGTYSAIGTNYTWHVFGQVIGPRTDSTFIANPLSLGTYNNNFVTIGYDNSSCLDTVFLNKPIFVRGPEINFTITDTACFDNTFIISNSSKPFYPQDSVTLWFWDYGNQTKLDTVYQPRPLRYANPGNYNVRLTGVDKNGCRLNRSLPAIAAPYPYLLVVPKKDTLCLGQGTTLKAYSDNLYTWTPTIPGACVGCDSVNVNPTTTTTYYATATNFYGCVSRDSSTVLVYTPFTITSPSLIYNICQNDVALLQVTPANKRITWSPAGSLSGSNIFNPVASPTQSTSYKVVMTDSAGCYSDSLMINVNVKSLPTVNAGPDKTVPYDAAFSLDATYSNNARNYAWTPANQLSCTDCPTPSGTAFNTVKYLVTVTSDSGCIAKDSIIVFVECKNANILMPSAFTPNNDNLNDHYYPIARGIKLINKFAIYNRNGQIVYIAGNFPPNSRSFGWNGQFKGQPQPSSGYVYVLEAVCDQGATLTKSGNFILLR